MMRSSILIVAALVLAGFKTGQLGSVDISYDFESVDIASGPDTFELFEASTAEVSLSSQYAFRGSHSLHLQDRANNRTFPEFQGYFPTVSNGTLNIGFALMTPTPNEPFNIAFAGSQHFRLTQDGIGFWLLNDAGTLRHMSDSIPKRLFNLTAYQWYWFEIELDVSNGTYSLLVRDEAGRKIVNLIDQTHPSNTKKSSLRKYSFAGDMSDRGSADFYIDEFVLRTDYADSPSPLIAPGRRTLFVDQWNEYHKKIENLDFCLAPKLPYDFIDIYNTEGLKTLQDNVEIMRALLSYSSSSVLAEFEHEEALINGIAKWAEGCAHLKNGQHDKAIENLEIAQQLIGNSPATQQSLAIAYAKVNQVYAARSIISSGQTAWPDDVRWPVLSAVIGFMYGRAEDSESALSGVANSLEYDSSKAQALMEDVGWLTSPAARLLKSKQIWNEQTEDFIVAEQYYFALLWQSRYREAERYADDFANLLSRYDIHSPLWFERVGDAALFANDLSSAEREYKKVLKIHQHRMSTLQKLADVYFLQNRMGKERKVRESIFGALNYEQAR